MPLPSNIERAARALNEALKDLSDQQRMEVQRLVIEGYCDLCGTSWLPCFCAPGYDE